MKQIAIKVENKRQFDAVKQYYGTRGTHFPNRDFTMDNFPCHITKYSSNMAWVREEQLKDFEAISFDVFSQLTGVKVVDEIDLKFSQLVTGKVTKDRIDFYANGENHAISFLDKKDIEEIYIAINSLQ